MDPKLRQLFEQFSILYYGEGHHADLFDTPEEALDFFLELASAEHGALLTVKAALQAAGV